MTRITDWPIIVIDNETGVSRYITYTWAQQLMGREGYGNTPSRWPVTVVDTDTGKCRIVTVQRFDQLIHQETRRRIQKKFYATPGRKAYMRRYRALH